MCAPLRVQADMFPGAWLMCCCTLLCRSTARCGTHPPGQPASGCSCTSRCRSGRAAPARQPGKSRGEASPAGCLWVHHLFAGKGDTVASSLQGLLPWATHHNSQPHRASQECSPAVRPHLVERGHGVAGGGSCKTDNRQRREVGACEYLKGAEQCHQVEQTSSAASMQAAPLPPQPEPRHPVPAANKCMGQPPHLRP